MRYIAVILVILIAAINVWDNWDLIKLHGSRFYGYFTLSNNPLLPGMDDDLKYLNDGYRIEPKDIISGGPPRDGVPSIDFPKFDTVKTSPFADDTIVIGIYINGEAKAYPYNILNWHEIVNDTIAGIPISVTLCPLCDTNTVFIRNVDGKTTNFGVSGKLFQSCLIMYDKATESLWSQVWGLGVAGEKTNQPLKRIPAVKTTLGLWKQKHPETQILSTATGHNRDYFSYPYGSYYTDKYLVFPVRHFNPNSVHPKKIGSIIFRHDLQNTPINQFYGDSVQVFHEQIQQEKSQSYAFGSGKVTAKWDDTLQTVRFYDAQDQEVPSITHFAFVYPAYFSDQ